MNTILQTCMASALAVCFGIVATSSVAAESIDSAANQAVISSFADAVRQGSPLTSFRLRHEGVRQDGLNEQASALTVRSLIGWETAAFNDFKLGLQLIDVSKINDDFNDRRLGVNQPGRSAYPIVADPDYTNVNQAYIDWMGVPSSRVRFGRQSLKLDNTRFIGNVEFRQVMQVFDGLTIENKPLTELTVLGGWYWQNRNINAALKHDRTGILHADYQFREGEHLVAYAYTFDQADVPVASNISNATYGLRMDGKRAVAAEWQALYTAEYALQHALGDSRQRTDANGKVDAHYYRIGGGIGYQSWFARIDQELLSSRDGRYAFQTPLGTNHLFQGWVDKFLVTPAAGMRDTFITLGGKHGQLTLLTEFHWFDADHRFSSGAATARRYGSEWDVSVAYGFSKQLSTRIEYGSFREKQVYTASRFRDTEKVWVTMLYAF